ncbi:MAG: asparaginase [Clostridia bacterium]|nr:asparaginase [Clostridia bacterium]
MASSIKNRNGNNKVLIIYTGGTIGMKRTPHGYTPSPGFFAEAVAAIPDMTREDFPDFELVELSPLLDSSDMALSDWNKIASVIYEGYDRYAGFVVLHGTDTMAYTASALSFILDGLDKPVILTGSQIPLSELRSDGRDNLITSVMIAADGVVREVALYFSGRLLRGNRAMKMSADGLIAFDSPNYPHLAEVGISIRYNYPALRQGGTKPLTFRPFSELPIGVLKVFPGIQFGLFEDIMADKLSGIVLETFGAGNIPGGGDRLLPIIKKAFNNGAVVVVCSQCPSGTVTLGAYESSSALKNAGAVSGRDMTTEAAVAKLYHLFSLGIPKDEIKRLIERDLAGELSEL